MSLDIHEEQNGDQYIKKTETVGLQDVLCSKTF